jgi:hypothetical protein
MQPVLNIAYDPVDPAAASDPGSHSMITALLAAASYTYNSTGATSGKQSFPPGLFLDNTSIAAASGYGTVSSNFYFFNTDSEIVTYNTTTQMVTARAFADAAIEKNSLTVTANGTASFIGMDASGNQGVFTLNLQTGAFANVVSSASGGFLSTTTEYEHFGADGLLYVLDYGNNRMDVLDPNNAFAQVRQFTLQGTVANMQFAMGFDGSIFLGDGAGGGEMYNSTGDLLSTFTLPAGSYTDPFPAGSASYIDETPDGSVFVFDSTGAHQYSVSAIPEPSAAALLAVGVVALRRRRD